MPIVPAGGRPILALLSTLGFAALCGTPVAAQDSLPPWQGGITWSLGQPSRTTLFAGGSAGADWRGTGSFAPAVHASLGVFHYLGNPVVGALAAEAQAYAGFVGGEGDGGVRARLAIPILRVSAGVDFNAREGSVAAVLGFTTSVRRGGVFGGGSLLRVEWSSSPLGALRTELIVPLGQPTAGRTRPREQEVDIALRAGPPRQAPVDHTAADPLLGDMVNAAWALTHVLMPDLEPAGSDPVRALAPVVAQLRAAPAAAGLASPYLDGDAVVRRYHQLLEEAFGFGTGGDSRPGAVLADTARAILLTRVIYPYNRLLGRWRTGSTIAALAAHARGGFARAVVSGTLVPPEREAAVRHVFDELLDAVVAIEHGTRARSNDSRSTWLPLQLGLRPEDHDTQAELDAILEAGVGAMFTSGNQTDYIVNDQFQAEVVRTIQSARDYHVLWIHDFRGRDAHGLPDANSLRYVVDAYLAALAAQVEAYDRHQRLPTYMILLDQHYYEVNHGRLWLDLLEDPLRAHSRLPAGFDTEVARIDAAQARLRHAVEGSRLLQAERRQYGDDWLHNLVKVHVSITNPADRSFWSRQVVPVLGTPDNLMRDHRKIVFYDVTEADPYRGEAIYTGMGIGEHYTGPEWEDRALVVRGPALLSLKGQARRLLERHGLTGDQIPYVLRARPLPPDYPRLVEAGGDSLRRTGGRDQRVLELHNLTGFDDKQLGVARAILYSLMPPGSVIEAPDSLWGNALLAALLTGSAFRGCRVLIVAPSLAAAPSAGWPQMALAHDLLARLIVLQQEFGPDLVRAGGMLKTGIYHPGIGVQDIPARFGAAYANARRTPFLRRLYAVSEQVDSLLVRLGEPPTKSAAADGTVIRRPEVMPKLHLKATFLASREAWDSLVTRPEFGLVLQAYLQQMLVHAGDTLTAHRARANFQHAATLLETAYLATLDSVTAPRAIYYLMVGSANQDYRSAYMDGEASVILAGSASPVSLMDFGLIMGLSYWIDDLEMLDALLPAPSEFQRALARQARPAL